MSGESVLALKKIVKTYRDGETLLPVLRGVDLSVAAGETIAIVGRSGTGKSTILNLTGLLDRPDSGEIVVNGIASSSLSESRRTIVRGREIGFVFQNYHMLSDFSTLENVMLGAAVGLGGGFGRANRVRALELLERVGLTKRARHRPHQLSGGEQQRAAIARALMAEPRILLCDEPTGNLDTATGSEVSGWLWRVVQDAGMAMIIVTHEQGLAERADRILCLENGVLSEESRLVETLGQNLL